jgi:DNA helicase II / ATP-dependent DNA helicase PcrA
VAPEDLLHDLDESQRRAVTSPARPLAILAPAGSGKTRVLTRRIAWRVASGDAEDRHVLALTFTRKAAGELRDRLARLGLRDGVAAGTFHGIAYAQLRTYWSDQGRAAPTLLHRKGPLLSEVLRGQGRDLTPAALGNEIEWAKARLLDPGGYAEGAAAAQRRSPVPRDRIAPLYTRYEQLKRERALVDFDDLLKLCADALHRDTTFAAAQRWRFRHLFVDEFQDVNPLQLHLLDAWRGAHYDLCVVGDPQQAIYGWNGSDAALLEHFQTLYPPAEVVALDRNYRSTPQVLVTAQHVLRRARLDPTPIRPTRLDGSAPRLHRFPTDLDEARAVARAVRDHRTPRTPWSAQAVLVRTHGQVTLVTEGLRATGIPHTVRGAGSLLERPQVRAALDLLRRDDRPLATCLPDVDALLDDGDQSQTDGAVEVVSIAEMARDHLRIDRRATGAGFATWLVATLQAEGVDGGRNAVTVATFHAAKGLEWPVVHLAGLEDGFTPIGHARTIAERHEEARLLYVAMTRAIETLHCTWAAQRSFGGKVVDRRLCPWLRDLADAQAAPTARPPEATTAPDWRERLAEQRARLAAVRPVPTPALSALLEWRDEAARSARIDPTAVLDDELLERVAAASPSDRAELSAIPGIGPLLADRIGDGLLAALGTAGNATPASADTS